MAPGLLPPLRRNPLVPVALGMLCGFCVPLTLWYFLPILGAFLVLKHFAGLYPDIWQALLRFIIGIFLAFAVLQTHQGKKLKDIPLRPGASLQGAALVGKGFVPPAGSELYPWFEASLSTEAGKSVRLRVLLAEEAIPPLPGTIVSLDGFFEPAELPRNPYEWDEKEFFRNRQLSGKLWQRKDREIKILHASPWWHPLAFGERIRRSMVSALSKYVTDIDQRAVVLGIALGVDEGMQDASQLAFRRTGSLHLFSVSGMHVGMLVGLLWLMLSPFSLPRPRLVWIILPCVIAYALITGWESPAVRASIMTCVLLTGLALDRTPRILNSLAAAFIILLVFDPAQRHDLGFQLTFSVVLAIVLLGLPLADKFSIIGQPDPFLPQDLVTPAQRDRARYIRMVMGSLAFGIAANIGSLPLSLHHFNIVTPVGIFLGIVLVPLAWLILALALMASIPASLGLGGFATIFGYLLGPLAAACIQLCTWASTLPAAWIVIPRPPPAKVEALVFDLDKGGSSVLIRTGGHAYLTDTGNPGHSRRITSRALGLLGAIPPDLLLLTHKDVQHSGGLEDFVLATKSPRLLWNSPAILKETFSPNTTCEILFPPPNWSATRADDRCAVPMWSLDGWKILWLGDAGFTAQKWMLDNLQESSLQCDVLCVGWHSTDIGLMKEFILKSSPKLVIWHRWRPETLNPPNNSLRKFIYSQGIHLMDQSATGAVTLRMGDDRLEATPFLQPNKIWTLTSGEHEASIPAK